MLPTDLNPTYNMRVNVRPLKHAYFIREDDVSSLAHVMKYACTQWGGVRNLIIPLRPDRSMASIFEHILKIHEPDRFVEYVSADPGSSADDHNRIERLLAGFWPQRKIALEKGDRFEHDDPAVHTLNAIPEERLRSEELLVYKFVGVDPDDPMMLAMFGRIYPGQEDDYAGLLRLAVPTVGYSAPDFWRAQAAKSIFSSPLNLTGYGIGPYEVVGPSVSNHFDVVLASSPSSIALYWDFRAIRDSTDSAGDTLRRTLLLPASLVSDPQALERMTEFIRSALPYPNTSTNLHIRFACWETGSWETLEGALGKVRGLRRFTAKKITTRRRWSDSNPRQLEDLTGVELTYSPASPDFPRSYKEGIGVDTARRATLQVGRNELLFEPPPGYGNRLGQAVAVDLECDVWQRYPRDAAAAASIKSGSWSSQYGITFAADLGNQATYLDLQLPGEWEVLRSWFARRGFDVRESQPSKYASALVRLLGSLSQVDAIASKPAYLLLDSLALKSTKKLAQRIVSVLQERGVSVSADLSADIQPLLTDMEIVPELQRVPRTYRQLCSNALLGPHRRELLGILGRLSEIQLVRRGFYLTCPNCGIPSWYPLEVVRETITCLGCSHSFALPVEKPTGNEIQWEYTLNTLVNRAVEQDVLPVLLAIRYLAKGKSVSSVVPGLELLQDGNVKVELDFTFISDHEISSGECKAGREIGAKDIAAARLVAQFGVKHFHFCTVSKFDDKSVELIDGLRKQLSADGLSMDVSVVDGDQLLGEALA